MSSLRLRGPCPTSVRARFRARLALGWSLLVLVVLAAAGESASAQVGIFRTRRSASSVTLPLVFGGGLEFENDSEQTQYDAPLLLQYSFSETFQATFETAITHIQSKGSEVDTVTGVDDLETSVEFEFLRERRYRPSLTGFTGVRWPTSTSEEIGSPGTDFLLGLIAAKEFDSYELDLNAIYTLSGDPDQQNILELPVAVEYPLTHTFSLAGEIAPTFDMGGGGESGAQTEFTLGCIWRSSLFWTLESGVVLRDDGSWQLVFGWEYSLAGDY